jgi:hypothetical protein
MPSLVIFLLFIFSVLLYLGSDQFIIAIGGCYTDYYGRSGLYVLLS